MRVQRVMSIEINIVEHQVVVNMLEGNGQEEVDWSKAQIDLRRL